MLPLIFTYIFSCQEASIPPPLGRPGSATVEALYQAIAHAH